MSRFHRSPCWTSLDILLVSRCQDILSPLDANNGSIILRLAGQILLDRYRMIEEDYTWWEASHGCCEIHSFIHSFLLLPSPLTLVNDEQLTTTIWARFMYCHPFLLFRHMRWKTVMTIHDGFGRRRISLMFGLLFVRDPSLLEWSR